MSDEIVAATLPGGGARGSCTRCCAWARRLAQREGGETPRRSCKRPARARAGRPRESVPPRLVTVAYEPLWAIGTGVTATPEQVHEMTTVPASGRCARSVPRARPRCSTGARSIAENAASLVREGDVDGFLVGGASLKAESFCAILQACDDCYALKR